MIWNHPTAGDGYMQKKVNPSHWIHKIEHMNHKKSRGNSELDPSSCREFARWPWVEGTVDGRGWASWSCRGHMPPWDSCRGQHRVSNNLGRFLWPQIVDSGIWPFDSLWKIRPGTPRRPSWKGQWGHVENWEPGNLIWRKHILFHRAVVVLEWPLMKLVRTQQEDETDKLDWTSGDDFVMHEIKIC